MAQSEADKMKVAAQEAAREKAEKDAATKVFKVSAARPGKIGLSDPAKHPEAAAKQMAAMKKAAKEAAEKAAKEKAAKKK